MSRDRSELQAWYRGAMRDRIDELSSLRGPIGAGDAEAVAEARETGRSLRGSGATYGFDELTAVAAVVETSDDANVLRRLEGLITELHAVARGDEEGFDAEWLLLAAGLDPASGALAGVQDILHAWRSVSAEAGLTSDELAARVATYLSVEVADLSTRSATAERLVPGQLVAVGRVIPLAETTATLTVATSDPTSLTMELELRRLTGREPIFAVATPEAIEAVLTGVLGGPPPPAPTTATPVRPAPRRVPDTDPTVLVVDDDGAARILMRGLLEKRDYVVEEAKDGLDALEQLRAGTAVDLVLIDLNMPRMDGLELIWELRDDELCRHLPLIVVTAEQDEVLETQLLEEGADDYLTKPLDPRLFLARVEATLRRFEGIAETIETS